GLVAERTIGVDGLGRHHLDLTERADGRGLARPHGPREEDDVLGHHVIRKRLRSRWNRLPSPSGAGSARCTRVSGDATPSTPMRLSALIRVRVLSTPRPESAASCSMVSSALASIAVWRMWSVSGCS